MKHKPLSWKPVRRGDIYCAPACGGDCKHSDYLDAQLQAASLAMHCGSSFKPRVWENLGWHYAAVSKDNMVKVHPSYGDGYIAFFGWSDGPGGDYTARGKTPQAAIRSGLKEAQRRATDANALVATLEASLTP